MQSIKIPLNIVSIDLYKLPVVHYIPIGFINIVRHKSDFFFFCYVYV